MKEVVKSSPNRTNQFMTGNSYEITHYRDKYLKDVSLHSHDFYELYYFISGNVSYVIDNVEYKLNSGDILLISPNNLHRPNFNEELEYERIVMWINPKYLKEQSTNITNLAYCFEESATTKSFLIRDYVLSEKIKSLLINLEKITNTSSNNVFGEEIKKEILIKEILICLGEYIINTPKGKYNKKSISNKTIIGIVEYIDNNFVKDISIEKLANMFYISKYYLLHLFKKEMSVSIHEYIIKKRLVYSKRLIEQNENLETVAFNSGFKDYSTFFRAFKEEFNISPREYKNIIKY